ncbi:hypothetical protein AWB65_05138 [Caballeronia humi]|uniref:Uncharacterized protein n=1 Tax=Caballeronia humi TaxID=326474 RepID=A0A158INM1_9BURK|nr:hypothetical protein AWB65_05138 [Caballeronia humi]
MRGGITDTIQELKNPAAKHRLAGLSNAHGVYCELPALSGVAEARAASAVSLEPPAL